MRSFNIKEIFPTYEMENYHPLTMIILFPQKKYLPKRIFKLFMAEVLEDTSMSLAQYAVAEKVASSVRQKYINKDFFILDFFFVSTCFRAAAMCLSMVGSSAMCES